MTGPCLPPMVTEFAPAKINLALHVTGQRSDGYHQLDSIVVFAGVGDRVTVAVADTLTLQITGAQGLGLSADDNLVLRAARAFGSARGALITLEKSLPIASGIGGGSADAAATLRALMALWGVALPIKADVLAIGADVPVCLAGRPARMTGIGEGVTPLPALPPAWLVLVNPGVGVATPSVFKALTRKENAPLPRHVPRLKTSADLAAWLLMLRNDLEGPAMAKLPMIATVNAALSAQQGCLMARMSGSGATCFGLFADPLSAAAAARTIRAAHPAWWVADAPMLT
jgi:4-diphosphocytidyl-2-C-methyl-D-erythritol kinase